MKNKNVSIMQKVPKMWKWSAEVCKHLKGTKTENKV